MTPCQYAEDYAAKVTGLVETNNAIKDSMRLIIAKSIQDALDHAADRIIHRAFSEGSEMCMPSAEISDHVLGVIAMDIIRMEEKA